MVAGLLLVACSSAPQSTVPPEPITESAVDVRLQARCGVVKMPVTDEPTFPTLPIDADAQTLLEGAVFMGFNPGRYEWFIAEQADDRILLFGRPLFPVRRGEPDFADALFVKNQGEWALEEFGPCHLEVVAPGFGHARWILDPAIEPDPASNLLSILTMERSCASGRPPIGREVFPVVVEQADHVFITVSIEPVVGGADCPGNPWHPIELELDFQIGGHIFFDGGDFPPIERPWPPTQTSLTSHGDP